MIKSIREYDTDMIPLPRMSEYLLDDFMIPMGLTAEDVSKGTGISLHDVRAILVDAQEITLEISEKLGEYFGVSAMLFYDIQQDLKARAEVYGLALA